MVPIQEERGASPFHELLLVSQPSEGHLRTNLKTSLRGYVYFILKNPMAQKNGA
jgi:hypothetical protein